MASFNETLADGAAFCSRQLHRALTALRAETASETCTPETVRARMVEVANCAGFFGHSLTGEELYQVCATYLPLSERGCYAHFGL